MACCVVIGSNDLVPGLVEMKKGDAVTTEVTSSNDIVTGSNITSEWSNEQ